MTRDKAQEAVDEAFASSVRQLFDVLVSNLVTSEADAALKFHSGLAKRDEAHVMASKEVEAIFPK